MIRSMVTLLAILASVQLASAELIRVVDEAGKPVDKFEAMYHTADQGYSLWEAGRDGQYELHFGLRRQVEADVEAVVVDVLVRADGYATAVKRFYPEEVKEWPAEGATVTLTRGEKVKVRFKLPQDTELPEDFVPESYFSEYAERVRMMWQPQNQRIEHRPFNFLNISAEGDGTFAFHVADDAAPFILAIDEPGWLRFCEFGPFKEADVKDGTLTIPAPAPSAIEVRFDTGDRDISELSFKDAACTVMWKNPDGSSGSYFSVNGSDGKLTDGVYRVADLGPGDYLVQVRTSPKDDVANLEGTEINPGRFFDQRRVTTAAGETAIVDLKYVPYDPEACHGTANAEIALLRADGAPAAGNSAKVEWFDGHYGSIKVLDQTVPEDGIVKLAGVSAADTTGGAMGSYTVSLEGERIGFFSLKETDEIQKFEFRMAPRTGDAAPDFSFVDVESEQHHRLADLKGKIVLVEFWATWCGPCQPAMAKLVKEYEAHAAAWKDDVVIVALSTDDSREHAARHVKARAWNSMPQYWAARPKGERLSEVEQTYVVHGIPHAILIDAEGKIAWRGHPMASEEGLDVAARIEALRKP